MTMKEFQEWVAERNRYDAASIGKRMLDLEQADPRLNAGHLLNGALGMTTESAELLDLVKKVVVHERLLDGPMKRQMLLEVGDALHYLTLMCSALGITVEQVIAANVEKLRKRDEENPDHYGKQ